MTNLVIDLFEKAGRLDDLKSNYKKINLRNYEVAKLNKILHDNIFVIELSTKKLVGRFTNKEGITKDYNLRISAYGRSYYKLISTSKYSFRDNISIRHILYFISEIITKPEIKEIHISRLKAELEVPKPCGKCVGQGYIYGYSHYADGVCFDCYGSGIIFVKQEVNL